MSLTLTLLLREHVVRIVHRKEQLWAQLTHISAEFRSLLQLDIMEHHGDVRH